jgi:hypothetical protein
VWKPDHSSVPWTNTRGKHFLQAFQEGVGHSQDFPSCLRELGIVLDVQLAHVDQNAGSPHNLPRQSLGFSGMNVGGPIHANHGLAPLLVSPPAPPGLSPIGREETHIPPSLDNGSELSRPRMGGAHLGGKVPPNSVCMGVTRVTFCSNLAKWACKSCQSFLPRNDDPLSVVELPLPCKELLLLLSDHRM